MPSKPVILIAGAGLGGLTAAIACAKFGMKVQVFEQAPKLGEIGAGVQVSPSGLQVLDQLGLKSRVLEECYNPVGREMLVWNTGYGTSSPIRREDMISRYGQPHVAMHRADLHAILVEALEALQPGAIQVNAKVTGFEDDGQHITLKLADGRSFQGDALIGADGLHSVIRRQLFGASKAQFTGGIAWRGLVPAERVPDGVRSAYGQSWVGLKGHFVVYPVRRGELINIVGHIERSDWQVESWTERGTTEEMLHDFAGWHDHVHTLIKAIEVPYKWALFLHPTLQHWSVGRATLMGDACHATLPYLAYGANMAIEDGYVVARCLNEHGGDVVKGLKRYEELRVGRTTRIVQESAANVKRIRHPDLADPESAKAYVDREQVAQRDDFDWLFKYDAAAVAV